MLDVYSMPIGFLLRNSFTLALLLPPLTCIKSKTFKFLFIFFKF